MRSFLLSSALILFLLPNVMHSQAVLSLKIHLPTIQVDVATESYAPNPLPVTATIYNTGTTASTALSARISLVAGLALDSSEHSMQLKVPTPAVVPPGDSATVVWQIVVPPSFSVTNYRVYVWLKYSPTDSLSSNYLFTVPAMDPPILFMTPTGLADLAVRADSMGYVSNPFDVNFRFSNAGGTTADSVSVMLQLPPNYVLDPDTQDNPMRFSGLMAPQAAGGPRHYVGWTVRYIGATRVLRSDTLRFLARARDISGSTVEAEAATGLSVAGMTPVVDIVFMDPGALQYDSVRIYSPLPYPLIVRLTNDSEQWTDLDDMDFTLLGVGISTSDPLIRPLPALSPGSYLDLTWRVAVERRDFSRQFVGRVAVRDAEGVETGDQRIVDIPGQPYALTVREATLPDSLSLNVEGTALLSRQIPFSYRIQNDTWYNSTVIDVKVQSMGQGVESPPFHLHQPMFAIEPGEMTPVLRDTFMIEPALKDRIVSLAVLAISDQGDSARSMHPVRIPGVMPVFSMTRRGVDRLEYQPGATYTPNPFSQEYTLRNEGNVSVRIDSIVLRYHMDGVTSAQPLRRDIGWMLPPGDSLQTRWDFSVYVRDTLRRLPMQVTAYMSAEYYAVVGHVLEIPPLFPVLSGTVSGPDTLSYDPVTYYVPNPFTKTLLLHNTGNADLLLDSVRLQFQDALVSATTPIIWSTSAVLQPDSMLALEWSMHADERDTELQLPLVFHVYHSGSKSDDVYSSVYIPGLRPGLEATVLGNAQLLNDPITIYRPDPFLKTVRIRNSGTADLQVDSIVVSFTDPGLQVVESSVRVIGTIVPAGNDLEEGWHFHAAAHASSGYASINFTLFHSGGDVLPLRSEIFIPGEPFAFSLADVEVPDRLLVRSDGQGYEGNPVVIRYAVENEAWFASSLTHVRVVVEGEGVQMLTPQPWNPALALSPYAKSATLKDSFFVLPATFDRAVKVRLHIEGSRGLGDSASYSMFVPRIISTSTDGLELPAGFAIQALYPNPVSRHTGGVLSFQVRSERPFRWEIVDMLGRRVRYAFEEDPAPIGIHREISLVDLRQGGYVLRVHSGGQILTRSIIVLE